MVKATAVAMVWQVVSLIVVSLILEIFIAVISSRLAPLLQKRVNGTLHFTA